MTKLLTGLAAGSLMLLGAGTAFAADLYSGHHGGSIKDEVQAPYRACSGDRFAGFYAGGTIGMTNLNTRWEETSNDFGGSFLGQPQSETHSGFSGGITGGYNLVRCNFLVGIEADYNFASVGGTNYYWPAQQSLTNAPLGGIGITNTMKDFATLRARMGFVADRTLFFATGGLAWGNLQHHLTDLPGVDSNGNATPGLHYGINGSEPDFNGWKLGYAVGGGFETALTEKISLKAEGLYMDFGSRKYNFTDVGTPPDPYSFSNRANAVTARVGLNIKLGDFGHRGCGDNCAPMK